MGADRKRPYQTARRRYRLEAQRRERWLPSVPCTFPKRTMVLRGEEASYRPTEKGEILIGLAMLGGLRYPIQRYSGTAIGPGGLVCSAWNMQVQMSSSNCPLSKSHRSR